MRLRLSAANSLASSRSSRFLSHLADASHASTIIPTLNPTVTASKLNFSRRSLTLASTSKRPLPPFTRYQNQRQWHAIRKAPASSTSQRRLSSNSSSISSDLTTSANATSSTSAYCKPYYITTPIFYVNAIPHVGHLHSMVLADVLARWNQWRFNGLSQSSSSPSVSVSGQLLQPVNSILSTGTDEHGLKIQTQAQMLADQEKKSIKDDASLSQEEKVQRLEKVRADPKALCDRISQRFKALAEAANINYTRFIRTTETEHEEAVKALWEKLVEMGFIYKGSHEGWYAISDEAFYTSLQVHEVEDDKTGEKYMASIETGTRVEWTKEENYKFRMSAFKDQLIHWLENDPKAICPPLFHTEVLSELKSPSGLSDLSISRPRSRLNWGIQVPGDPDHTIYVWVDALTNYLTVSGYPWKQMQSPSGEGKGAWEGSCWPADVHVVGKDIIRFHAIYFPSLLMALDLPLPKTILTHSHWTMNKHKMSKSRGNVADPFAAMDLYGSDAIRWYLMRVGGTLDADSDYSPFTLQQHYKKNLAGQLGNLLSRISAPSIHSKLIESLASPSDRETSKDFISVAVPELTESDMEFVEELNSLTDKFTNHLESFSLTKANEEISSILMKINTIVQDLSPWLYPGKRAEEQSGSGRGQADVSSRNSRTLSEAHRAVYLSVEVLRIVSCLYSCIMPKKMEQLRQTLGFSDEDCRSDKMKLGGASNDGRMNLRVGDRQIEPLFPKVKEDVLSTSSSGEVNGKKQKKKKEKEYEKRK